MRIDKLLANMGYGSRKDVKKHLKNGRVTVNGQPIKDVKTHVDPNSDEIMFDDMLVDYKEYIYIMMNKPPGVISATEDATEHTVVDLLDDEEKVFDVFPVGRLDKDTEGLLLLTNDGKLAHELLSPKKHVPKMYYAQIDGLVDENDVQAFETGVQLDDGYVTLPAQLQIITSDNVEKKSQIELTITEGKFHQVKRMFLARGKKVTYLKRVKMGGLTLDPFLQPGDYREITDEELQLLKERG